MELDVKKILHLTYIEYHLLALMKESIRKKIEHSIVDFSAPYEHSSVISINDLIDKETNSLTYVTIDNVIELIKSAGVGALMCKCDICDAFKLVG